MEPAHSDLLAFSPNVTPRSEGSALRDLHLLNVTRETLYPSVDEAASAVTQQ